MALECVTSTARRHRLTRRERLLQPAAIGACFSLFGPSGYARPHYAARPRCIHNCVSSCGLTRPGVITGTTATGRTSRVHERVHMLHGIGMRLDNQDMDRTVEQALA